MPPVRTSPPTSPNHNSRQPATRLTAARENCVSRGGFSAQHCLRLVKEQPELKLILDTRNSVFQRDRSNQSTTRGRHRWSFHRERQKRRYAHPHQPPPKKKKIQPNARPNPRATQRPAKSRHARRKASFREKPTNTQAPSRSSSTSPPLYPTRTRQAPPHITE